MNPLDKFTSTPSVQPATAEASESVNPLAKFATAPIPTENPLTKFAAPQPATLEQPATTSVSGKPLSPEAQRILAEREKEKKAYETGYLGALDILKPEAREAVGGLWSALTTGKRTPEAEIKALAEKYEVSPEELRRIAPALLAVPEEKTIADVGMQALGYASEIAAGLPTFAAKKGLVDDPNMRAAIDDLREMSRERMGLAEWIGVNIIPGAMIGKALAKTGAEVAAKTLAKEAGEAAVTGAAFGLGSSTEGQEVTDTVLGASIGAGLAPAIRAIPAAYNKVKNTFFDGSEKALKAADNVTQDTAIKYAAINEADITNAVDTLYVAVKDNEAAIRDAALKEIPMSPEAATKVVAEMMTPDERRLAEVAAVDKYMKTLPRGERVEVDIPEGVLSDAAIAAEYVVIKQKEFAEKLVKEVPDLASVIDRTTGEPRPASTKDILREARRLGVEELDAKWDDAVRERLAKEAIKKKNLQLSDDNPLGKTIANGIGGRQFGIKVIDERSGIDALPDFNLANANGNLVTAERQRWRRYDKKDPTGSISGIYRAAKSVKDFLKFATAQDETNKYWTAMAHRNPAIRKAAYDALSQPEKKLLENVSTFFARVRERANSVKGEGINPLNIPLREDFGLPNITVKPTEYVIRLKGKLKDAEAGLKTEVKNLKGQQFKDALATNKELQDFVAGLKLIDTQLVDQSLDSGESLLRAMRSITSGTNRNTKLYQVAGTALARRDSVPEFLLEKNLFRLMDRYMDSTMRNVYLRRPLEQLAYKARILDNMNLKTEAEFLRRIVQDNYGIRAWSASKLFGEAQVAAADMARSVSRRLGLKPENEQAVIAAVNYIPEAIANIQYNIYPNVLGMNGKSHLTNLLQAWTKGAPELGRLYGYSNIGRTFFSTMAPNNWGRLMGRVKEWGLLPDTYIKEFAPAVEEGLARSTGWQFTKEQYAKFTKAWMYTYSKVEDFNRMVIVNMAETLVQDAADGNKGAIRAIAKMPLAIRRGYIKNKGNPDEQAKLLARHLNSVTAYNYNRTSMAEIGVHLGPFFATFTKWPTETLGDILADMRINGTTKAMPRLMEKYALTLAIANAIDSTLHWAASGDFELYPDLKETQPQVRYWLGTGGLKTAAPIQSLKQFMPATKSYERNPFTPVVLSTMWNDVLVPAWEGDTEKMQAGGMRALQTFAPFGMMSRFIMRDIPMAFEGEEPSTFKGK